MLSYCLKCKKKTQINTENTNPVVLKTSNGKTMISKCAVGGAKKSRFIKNKKQKDY